MTNLVKNSFIKVRKYYKGAVVLNNDNWTLFPIDFNPDNYISKYFKTLMQVLFINVLNFTIIDMYFKQKAVLITSSESQNLE